MKVVITGGLGFIGSAIVRVIHDYLDCEIVVIDKSTYASNKDRILGCKVKLIEKDICDIKLEDVKNADFILNFAAETHVDNSIKDGKPFIKSNVEGVFNLLEVARQIPNLKRFIQMSTDEVYGDVAYWESKIDDKLNPSSYYSASKAAADMLVKSAGRTYDLLI